VCACVCVCVCARVSARVCMTVPLCSNLHPPSCLYLQDHLSIGWHLCWRARSLIIGHTLFPRRCYFVIRHNPTTRLMMRKSLKCKYRLIKFIKIRFEPASWMCFKIQSCLLLHPTCERKNPATSQHMLFHASDLLAQMASCSAFEPSVCFLLQGIEKRL